MSITQVTEVLKSAGCTILRVKGERIDFTCPNMSAGKILLSEGELIEVIDDYDLTLYQSIEQLEAAYIG